MNIEILKDGKDCLSTLASQLKQFDKLNLQDEIVHFFSKICIFFKIRYLNKKLKIGKKESSTKRIFAKKMKKMST